MGLTYEFFVFSLITLVIGCSLRLSVALKSDKDGAGSIAGHCLGLALLLTLLLMAVFKLFWAMAPTIKL